MNLQREAIRQRREAFDQLKWQDQQWFTLRLTMGYCSVALLISILIASAAILWRSDHYPSAVVVSASAAIFVDVLGLVLAVWKIALQPSFGTGLHPTLQVPRGSHSEAQ